MWQFCYYERFGGRVINLFLGIRLFPLSDWDFLGDDFESHGRLGVMVDWFEEIEVIKMVFLSLQVLLGIDSSRDGFIGTNEE